MAEKQTVTNAQLFTLRLWVEEVDHGRSEFRGTLKHVLSGDTHHFRDWPTLICQLEAKFALNEVSGGSYE